MSEHDDEKLLERLARLDTSIVSDVLDEAGLPNHALSSAMRLLDPATKLVGRAFCAQGHDRITAQNPPVGPGYSPYAMEERLVPGDVAVIASSGHAVGSMIGGLMAYCMQSRGCRGLVTDGGIRDAAELKAFGFPAFSSFHTPLNSSRRWSLSAIQEPVQLPGMAASAITVNPGDLLLGDVDGLVVIPRRHAEPIIAASEELAAIEGRIWAMLRAGSDRRSAFEQNPRFRHIRPVDAR